MWKIIKADFRYHKFVFIVPVTIVLAGLVANLVQGWRQLEHDFQGMRTVMAVATAFIFLIKYLVLIGEKRTRHNMLLPMKRWQIGLPRLLYGMIVWAIFLVLYWVSTATARPYRIDVITWDTISFTGLVLIANALMFIFVDLTYVGFNKIQEILLTLLARLLLLAGFVAFFIFGVSKQSWNIFKILVPYKADFSSFSATAIGAMISLLIGIAATYVSVMVFKHRKTYLQ